MKREEKAEVVQELSASFAKAKLAVLTDYRGLTVSSMQQLRRELRDISAELKVAKNTLLNRAIQGTPFEPLSGHLKGNTALTLSEVDPVAPAKVLTKFAKDNPKLVIKTAVLDGKELTPDDLTALSKLPGINELRAQFLGLLQAVPTGFVRVLNGVPQKAVYLLQAIKEQKEQTN
ncbi:50S ribosomal protein L10 [Desulfurivibrio alkaliphilus]|uniref:Large ribosomal subunit protein uL10 n=1 Tax=Desulfurivibrio alkaliphilus (strain DSM 19089 / UNIQEM U267 / AHT2) TaxID=589865 RepID=D6Z3N1_DESAT|nr:50S ribosomal protein L10 [Desulfurivibrio alkaliphilus]ADH86156.1 ribosomal protein L10 [Desulfurivibrio alkaliphilus AHT 2]